MDKWEESLPALNFETKSTMLLYCCTINSLINNRCCRLRSVIFSPISRYVLFFSKSETQQWYKNIFFLNLRLERWALRRCFSILEHPSPNHELRIYSRCTRGCLKKLRKIRENDCNIDNGQMVIVQLYLFYTRYVHITTACWSILVHNNN